MSLTLVSVVGHLDMMGVGQAHESYLSACRSLIHSSPYYGTHGHSQLRTEREIMSSVYVNYRDGGHTSFYQMRERFVPGGDQPS